MKRMLCTLLAIILVSLLGSAVAQSYTGYTPLNTAPEEAIAFDGYAVTWGGQTFVLDENTYFLDYRLDEKQLVGNPYAFQDIREALAALHDGTAEQPMTLLIAPGVYWLRNFGSEGGTDSLHCAERAIHVDCEYLHLVGLSSEANNVVVGLEHRETLNDYCRQSVMFSMFVVEGQGLRCENLTIGSYETHALEYVLAPELSRERQVRDPYLQQMLFSTGNDGVMVNCCFEGRMSLNRFAKYYKNCRMLAGCRAETGVCIECEFELNDHTLGMADLFGCEVFYDPIVKARTVIADYDLLDIPIAEKERKVFKQYVYIDKYVDEMYRLPEDEPVSFWNYYGIHSESVYGSLTAWVRLYCLDSNAIHALLPLTSPLYDEEWFTAVDELRYAKYRGECAEMGFELEIVNGPYAEPKAQAAHDKKIAQLQEQIEQAMNEAVKKILQKNLDAELEKTVPSYVDLYVPMEVRCGTGCNLLRWSEIEAILAWEEKNPGKYILLPQLDTSITNSLTDWYQTSNGKPVYDAEGNLQDAYLRDENGDVVRYQIGKTNSFARYNRYNYFLFLYGVAPEIICENHWDDEDTEDYPVTYIVDTNFSLGSELKQLEWDVDISTSSFIWSLPCFMNLSVEHVLYDLPELCDGRYCIIPDDLANGVRVETADGVIYNLANLYGEDPFGVTEVLRQSAVADGLEPDAYLNIPLEYVEE